MHAQLFARVHDFTVITLFTLERRSQTAPWNETGLLMLEHREQARKRIIESLNKKFKDDGMKVLCRKLNL